MCTRLTVTASKILISILSYYHLFTTTIIIIIIIIIIITCMETLCSLSLFSADDIEKGEIGQGVQL